MNGVATGRAPRTAEYEAKGDSEYEAILAELRKKY